MTRFLFYVARWQLSTPILWLVVSSLGAGLQATIIANLIGASIFFWVDRFIFGARAEAIWEVLRESECSDCGSIGLVRRLVLAPGAGTIHPPAYDRREDINPKYRCPECSARKLKQLQDSHIVSASLSSPMTG
jgi:hypothetical protein